MARSDLNLQSLCCSEIILLKKATPTIETKNQIGWSMENPENPENCVLTAGYGFE